MEMFLILISFYYETFYEQDVSPNRHRQILTKLDQIHSLCFKIYLEQITDKSDYFNIGEEIVEQFNKFAIDSTNRMNELHDARQQEGIGTIIQLNRQMFFFRGWLFIVGSLFLIGAKFLQHFLLPVFDSKANHGEFNN